MTPDLINAQFECLGGLFVLTSVFKIRKTKSAAGVSAWTVLFFLSWGAWNLYYYPHLGQLYSGWAACLVVFANALWLGHIWFYSRKQGIEFANLHNIPVTVRSLKK